MEDQQIYQFRSINYQNNRLEYVIQTTFTTRVVERYVQRNYVKIPIYTTSEKAKIVKRFNRVIKPTIFMMKDLPYLECTTPEMKAEICLTIHQPIPDWLKNEIVLLDVEAQQVQLAKNYEYAEKDLDQAKFQQVYPLVIDRESLIFSWIFFFIGLVRLLLKNSPSLNPIFQSQIEANKLQNNHRQRRIKNCKTRINELELNQIKLKDQHHKLELMIEQQIAELTKVEEIIEKGIEWKDLRSSLLVYNGELTKVRGVYVIWNKSKDKYYVGQSVNIGTRIFANHFKNGDVNNQIFMRDWINDDKFYYRYIENNKGSLNNEEKYWIDYYDSFNQGYNSTSGNQF